MRPIAVALVGLLSNPAAAETSSPVVSPKDATALKARLGALNRNIAQRGLHDFPGATGPMLTGYKYGEYYDWDLYFEKLYLSYYGESRYGLTNFEVFLDRQKEDGFISRTIGVTYPKPKQMFKPFLAQIAVLGAKEKGGDFEWLSARDYGRLKKYIDRWFAYDTDKNGLPVWNSADASGMDNQLSRAGKLDAYTDEGVDLACYLYRELQALELIAKKLGYAEEATRFRARATALAATINQVCWDDASGFYYDRNEKTGQRIAVKSVVGFIPLWVGIASPAQAKRLIEEHLVNPREFWVKYPIATYAASEPDFYQGTKKGECNWRGPAWIPTNYMIFHGLIDYGYPQIAQQLADKTFQLALHENKVTREYYDSDTGKGNGMNPFWGWSSLAYVMPFDRAEGYDPMKPEQPLRPLLKEKLGLEFSGPESAVRR